MVFGKVSFYPKHCVNMTREEFNAFFRGKGVNSKSLDEYWKEFSKEVAKYKPKSTPKKRVKKEEIKEEPKEETKETKED